MTQKRIAREVLIAGSILIVLVLAYSIFSMISNKKHNNLNVLKSKQEVLVKKFEDIEPFQKLWYELRQKKRFNEDYKDFLTEYGNIQRSEILFNLAKNNDLVEDNLDDFKIKYYKQESALEYLHKMNKFKSLEFNVFYDSIMTNENFTKKSYEMFILDGYNGSLIDFIELMREKRKFDESMTYSSINDIEADIETNKTGLEGIKDLEFYSKSTNLIEYLLWILGIICGLRIIIYILKWSMQNAKN